ncbi:insulinase family protein [Candidatus Gottesmanbacteria bacterium]|nr:insulinase family protein [Candidatus Gottesmanbacteria bacterium]
MTKKPYERTIFGNGVRLILVPMTGVNSVATSVMVAVGSRYETKAINGISHFLEHMVFKGTKKYPTTDDVNVIERAGGLQNAYTDIDITNYHNKVLASDWELALDINKELALHPRLEQKYVDKERDVILEEMKRYEDEPEVKVEDTFHQMMYPGTALGMRIIGEEASLRVLQGVSLQDYHDTWYKPEQIVVVLAGRITNNEQRIKTKAEEWFGPSVLGFRLSDSGQPVNRSTGQHNSENRQQKTDNRPFSVEGFERVTDHQDKPQLAVVTKPDVQQAHVMLGVRVFHRGSDDRFAWTVFNLLMGISFTSRLFKEIREKRGLCYHIRSSTNMWQDVGNWTIYAGVATEKVEEATQAILGELAKARDKRVRSEEVMVAKKRFKTLMAFRGEDPEFMAEYYGRQDLFGMPFMTMDEHLARIDAVTADDINKLLKKYIKSETLNMAIVWNKSQGDKLRQLLKL